MKESISLIVLIVIAIWGLGTLFCIFLLYRNKWVYRKLKYLIENDIELFDKLPSYEAIFLKFWVWDIQKFVR